ncbi:MAG TPA: helicase-related protein [Xanthobacteraceae bacterium]|nr:helicase-related protein [Xanthobacteraceae bacterium]
MPISFSPPADRDLRARGAGVTAVLGPTNTGKTHLAIERMLAHSSGIIGLPLRLLAREVYNRAVERVGAEAVALVTGEEKIKPPNPRFWVATVEAMPRDLDVAFVAVDEIQLAADFERGHVFTDRMLHRRGREETLVLGAATMRPIVERLLPGASIVGRPRLSQLSFAGEKKLTRLPRRSAIVAFSTDEVYAIAELIRRQRGGAAVVLGALSPRTRNAQVDLYQSGEVDYLVATDAIGMGLNLDVDHIAFAADRKFDGYQFRKLSPAELAQIAGRAGRATRDGTFGTTGRCPPFETELVQALESHTFEPVKLVQWRNTDLDFSSIGALQATLAEAPKENVLSRAPVAEDILVLDHAAREDEVRAMTHTRADVERLWDVCQIPDYRKIAPANHAELVIAVYGFLMREGRIETDWFVRQIAEADRVDGDIDTLSTRIAHIRTWTFAANRPDWLADPEHWQGVARAVEDKLSDALHERLTERFVDRRTSVLMRRLRENAELEPQINKSGEVIVEGHVIGRLDGFVFLPDASSGGSEAKALQNAAQKALAGEIAARASRLAEAPDGQLLLAADGAVRWTGAAVGKVFAGDDVLHPRVRLVADEHLTGAPREAVQARLDLWIKSHIEKLLGSLFELSAAADVTGIARGVAFQLVEALGVLDRQKVAEDVKGLQQPERASLRKYGVRFGAYHIYIPGLLKPAPRALAAQLFALAADGAQAKGLDDLLQLAGSGRTSIPVNRDIDPGLYRTAGYRVCGERAVRVDILERLADLIRPALAWREGAGGPKPAAAFPGGGFTVVNNMTSLIGASGEDFSSILRSLGYRMERRPKPAEPPVQPVAPAPESVAAAAETTANEPEAVNAGESVDLADETAAIEVAEEAVETEAVAPQLSDAAGEPVAADELAAAEEPPAAAPSEIPDSSGTDGEAEAAVSAESAVASVSAEPASAEAAPSTVTADAVTDVAAAQAPAAEAVLVEVWRPGRSEGRRRPRERRRDQRRDTQSASQRGQEAGAPGTAAAQADLASPGEAAAAAPSHPESRSERPQRQRWRGGGQRQDQRQDRRQDQRQDRPERPQREDRRPGRPEQMGRPPRFDRREREKAPDPNSPFAKLAALKAQLEAAAKERR